MRKKEHVDLSGSGKTQKKAKPSGSIIVSAPIGAKHRVQYTSFSFAFIAVNITKIKIQTEYYYL